MNLCRQVVPVGISHHTRRRVQVEAFRTPWALAAPVLVEWFFVCKFIQRRFQSGSAG